MRGTRRGAPAADTSRIGTPARNPNLRSVWAAALIAIVCVCASARWYPERFADLRAFYCAGAALAEHADPYREHPLGECERSVRGALLSPLRENVTVPAPFPGYVLAVFALLARLPFALALDLWLAASCACVAVSVLLLARVTGTSLIATSIVVAYPALTVALPLGQITPFVLVAITGAATLLTAGRPRLAALAALAAMLEPPVGVALALGLAVAVPRTRLTLAAGFALLAAVGLGASGFANDREYLQSVLPAHALANVSDSMQFSTASFAYVVGLPAGVALRCGAAWYLGTLVLGALAARRLTSRFGAAAPALLPPALAVFGGTYTHLAQLELAIPAFLLVVATLAGRRRAVGAVITFVAAMPWLVLAPFPLLAPATAILAATFADAMGIARIGPRLAAASFTTLIALFCAIVRMHAKHAIPALHLTGNPLAQVAWQTLVLARNAPPEYWCLFAKAPTVTAFVVFFGLLLNAALARHERLRPC